jgi:hypothetical protein
MPELSTTQVAEAAEKLAEAIGELAKVESDAATMRKAWKERTDGRRSCW